MRPGPGPPPPPLPPAAGAVQPSRSRCLCLCLLVWLHCAGAAAPPEAASQAQQVCQPREVQVLVSAEGRELTLHLERNQQLLAPGYQERWYGPDGVRRSSSPPSTAHCFYHGEVLGMRGSSVAVSTCSGLR
ncbi:Disintegrin and metalloproteinase domain-containing protein 33 [Liparis tanakae]|uniref:Disintegrin and metalloproteinase domain-containing protein 33 n=1 Tax=Liparis tanakae TaxID=230148 RepID=A0A4Z2F9X4_9TELE|nr:Disintegrin and metalloproteinase domain-containing protein 33 [Liparis tanakae]